MPQVAPRTSKPKPSSIIMKHKVGAHGRSLMRKRYHKHNAEKPEKIQAMLLDPERRKHVGPCCKSSDGTVCGTKKWGDGVGALYDDDYTKYWECMGCRKLLDEPAAAVAVAGDDFDDDVNDEALAAMAAAAEAKRG